MTSAVLVTGASGYIGSRLIQALLAQGIPVRAMSRRPERLRGLTAAGVDVVAGDVLDRPSLRTALQDVRAAYYLVHSLESAGSGFTEYDRYAAQNFTIEARNLEQIMYLGGLGDPADDLSPHLRSRVEVGEILLEGRAPATVFRAGMVIGSGSASFIMLRSLVEQLPVMICPEWVDTRSQPIAIDDVIAYLITALHVPEARGRSFEIGGPDVLTYRQMMDRVAAIICKRHIIVTVPVLTPRLSAYWVDFITPIQAPVAHALIEGLKNEIIVRDPSAQHMMPVPLTPFDEAVRRALAT